MPLSAAELVAHSGYKSVVWDLKPTSSGKCSVGAGRGGPFDLAYEIHGTGPNHLIVFAPARSILLFKQDPALHLNCLLAW